MKGYHIAVVGATGAAGTELLRVLERRNFPVASLRLIGSKRSAGKSVRFREEPISVQELDDRSFDKIDIAFFSAGGDVSRNYVPMACQSDAIAIDKSSAFRMDPHVPLVIPEINAEDVRQNRGVIANPNCTTTVMLMALYPLHCVFGVRRVFATSFQAVSGSGARGIEELKRQVAGKDLQPSPELYPHPIAFNLLPHIDAFLESGYTKEEAKMQGEAQKIMHLPELLISATCVRVPVYRAHLVAVSAEFERVISVEQAREVLAKAPGLELVDEPQSNRYPMPLSVAGKANWLVGPMRADGTVVKSPSFLGSDDQILT